MRGAKLIFKRIVIEQTLNVKLNTDLIWICHAYTDFPCDLELDVSFS